MTARPARAADAATGRPAVCVVVVPVEDPAVTARCLARLQPTLGPGDRVVLLAPHGLREPTGRAPLLRGAPDEGLEELVGRAAADAELVAELHADVTVTPHWLDRLVAALADPRVRAAGPRANAAPPGQALLEAAYDDGRTSLRDFARLHARVAPQPTAAQLPLGGFCRVSRVGAAPQEGDSVVVHGVFVHHAAEPGCPDITADHEPGPLLSAGLIVKDEQDSIVGCLAALRPFVDEVVVYDTGSTDATRELAASTGATVVAGFWDDDFGAARNRGLRSCTGRFVLVVDADEKCVGNPAALRAELATTSSRAYPVAIRNASSGDIGSAETHLALRLFRRTDAVYVGRLHEQVVHRRLGHLLNGPVAPHLHLRHSGYTEERFRERSKARRNVELAEAGWREAALTGTDVARNAGNLARALYSAGERERAMELFEQAWDGVLSRTALVLCTAAIGCALQLGRPEVARAWLERMALGGTSGPRWQEQRARVLAGSGRDAEALEVLERLPQTAVDEDGVVLERVSTAALRSRLLQRLHRDREASDVLLEALAADVSDRHLSEHLAVLKAAGRPVADLATALSARLRTAFLAQCLQVAAPDGSEVLEALWGVDPQLDVLAAASQVAPGLPVPQALEWSARLRDRGLAELCPLRRIAGGARPARDRVVAAAVARVTFGDREALPLLEAALQDVPADQERDVLAELRVLAPGLVEPAPA